LKVLYITNGFPPDRWAGTETYTAGIAKGIQQCGHAVQVICCGNWDEGEKYWNGYQDDVYNEVPVRRLNLNWQKAPDPNLYLFNNPVIGKYLDQYLDEVKPDLVHITSCETLSASVIEVVKKNNIPLVLSLTDFWFLCPRINLLHGDGRNCDGLTTPWDCLRCLLIDSKVFQALNNIFPGTLVESIYTNASKYAFLTRQRGLRGLALNMQGRKDYLRQTYKLADVRLTASQFVKDVHLQNDFSSPLRIHPYGHDLDWMRSYRGKQSSSTLRIGFIGQIIHSKGVHILLEAVKRLQSELGEQVNFLVYGNLEKEPGYGNRLRMLVEGMKNIQFCGTYAHEESARVYSNFDVLVVPSLWYDFPLVIYEAFATKTPVIATNLGGMAEAVQHEVNGLLFERNNVDELAHQIARLVQDPNLLDKLIKGIPQVKTIEQEIDELERIYLDLIEEQRKEVS
jgi:glycosyltransferase involved in cell wall biosynthesis